jgi:hypothetical protein
MLVVLQASTADLHAYDHMAEHARLNCENNNTHSIKTCAQLRRPVVLLAVLLLSACIGNMLTSTQTSAQVQL